MSEYQRHIDFFSNYWWAYYSKILPEPSWGNKKMAESYLEKYWLSESEYKLTWEPIQDKIFINKEHTLPDLIFDESFRLLPIRGGCLFLEKDFTELKKCFLELGEKYFIVIENTFGGKLNEPAFRLKFPTNISWEELISGNFISAVVFEMLHNEYYIFSESGNWGKYSASDYENPLDIIGFKPIYKDIFINNFQQSINEQPDIIDWLPPKYIERVVY